jgi:hypothetical protein
VNIPDTFLKTNEFKELLADLPPLKLAFNAVGGEAAVDLCRALGVFTTVLVAISAHMDFN